MWSRAARSARSSVLGRRDWARLKTTLAIVLRRANGAKRTARGTTGERSSPASARVGFILLERGDGAVCLGPAIAEELPGVADFADQIEVHVGDYDIVVGPLLARCDELSPRVYEITLPVKLADAPGLFPAGSIDRANEILICDGVRRLFELP